MLSKTHGVDIFVKSSHQYDRLITDTLGGLTELLSLWQTPQTKYKALWGLQEYTRLSFSLCRESRTDPNPDPMRQAAAVIIPALLQKVEELLATADNARSPPELGGQWAKFRVATKLPCPTLDRGWYYLGVLDCAAQLATLIDMGVARGSLLDKMWHLVRTSKTPEYRWKAMEVLFGFPSTRVEHFRCLRLEIEEISKRSVKDTLFEEASIIWNTAIRDEIDPRPSNLEPLTGEYKLPSLMSDDTLMRWISHPTRYTN